MIYVFHHVHQLHKQDVPHPALLRIGSTHGSDLRKKTNIATNGISTIYSD